MNLPREPEMKNSQPTSPNSAPEPAPSSHSPEGEPTPKHLPKPLPIVRAVEAMQTEGLASELTPEVLADLAQELCDADEFDGDFPFADVLDAYYCDDISGERRSIHDGYIRHDWRFGQETNDVVAELCALLGAQVYRQLSYELKGTGEQQKT
jgi:hypothetical protein